MNLINGKKMNSLVKNAIRLFEVNKKLGRHPHNASVARRIITSFSTDFNYTIDPDSTRLADTALLEAERKKAEATELARHLALL